MSGAYDDCGSDAYAAPRTLDLLQADYGDASQLTWYVGDDGLVHACAHNVLRSSANLEDGIWGGTGTVDGPQLLSLTAGQTGGYQVFNGSSNRYQSINGETYTLTATVEVISVTTPGTVNNRLLSNTAVNSTLATLTNIGDTADLSVTLAAGSTNMQVYACNSTTFEGTVKITNLCASVGSETFPYIKTGTTGARYSYRLPENLRRWSGTAYTTSKIVELNTGVTVNALVEGVGVTNTVQNSTWAGAAAGTLPSGTGTVPSTWSLSRDPDMIADGSISIVDTPIVGGVQCVDIRVSGTFASGADMALTVSLSESAVQGDVWTFGYAAVLIDDTDTSGLSSASMAIQEADSGGSYAGTQHTVVFSVASMVSTGIALPASVFSTSTVTIVQATAAKLNVRMNLNFVANSTDVTVRMAMPTLTKTSFTPQPILTYGSSVTRAAEEPVTSDFAGASTNGTGSIKTSFVVAHNGSSNGAISMNSLTTPTNFMRVLVRDSDLDGDRYVSLFNRSSVGDTATSFSESMLTDRVSYCAFGWNYASPSIRLAVTDLTTSQVSTATPTEIEADFGATISLISSSSTSPTVGYITADYIPNVFLTEAQYTGEAT
tara:strand:- start:45119 stop:46927 length:1809 start_codon:yes stop_codon:yes gene_type:complete